MATRIKPFSPPVPHHSPMPRQKFLPLNYFSGPVYTIPFSFENSTKPFRFGLPFTLKRSPNRHQMKTILKTERFENGLSRQASQCKHSKTEQFDTGLEERRIILQKEAPSRLPGIVSSA